MRLSPCVLVQPDGWARGEREGYGGPCDVTSLSLSAEPFGSMMIARPFYAVDAELKSNRS